MDDISGATSLQRSRSSSTPLPSPPPLRLPPPPVPLAIYCSVVPPYLVPPYLAPPPKVFKERFLEKTEINWEDRHHSVPVNGKYTLVERDLGEVLLRPTAPAPPTQPYPVTTPPLPTTPS